MVRLLIAFLLIIVGLIGLLFPIVPDWPLILVGIVIFDVRGGIRRRLIKILPKGWRERTHKILFSKVFNNLGE